MVFQITPKSRPDGNATAEVTVAASSEHSPTQNSENLSVELVNHQENLRKRYESLTEIARSLDPQRIETFLEMQKCVWERYFTL